MAHMGGVYAAPQSHVYISKRPLSEEELVRTGLVLASTARDTGRCAARERATAANPPLSPSRMGATSDSLQ